MQQQYQVSKSNCEQYVINFNQGFDYAVIFLDNGERSGTISILSSYGNYANHFSSTGIAFKDFLIDLDFDYFMTKTTKNHMEFSMEKTVEGFKKMVNTALEEEEITTEEAKTCLDEIDELEYCHDICFLAEMISNTTFENLFIQDSLREYTENQVNVQCEGFWREIWPKFIEILKKETEEKIPLNN